MLSAIGTSPLYAGQREDAIAAIISQYRDLPTGFGPINVEKVTINTAARTIAVACNENAAYVNLDATRLAALKDDIRAKLGTAGQYASYTVKITAKDKDLDSLVRYASNYTARPTEKLPFVQDLAARPAPAGLDGANIALWQSHGWYFEPKLNRWEWQRARVLQTVEDLYTQSYVMPYLMPMLQNAGAYVMSPRERDTNLTEIIIDADNAATIGYSEQNGDKRWQRAGLPGFAWDGNQLINGQHPFSDGTARMVATVGAGAKPSTASWRADIPEADTYAVYVSYVSEANCAPDALYTIHTATGPRQFTVNQTMGGGTWVYLGHFPLAQGDNQEIVTLTNTCSPGHVVTADAVKIGGGMGVVSRIVKEPVDDIDYEYVPSGYPKFVEGARYFLQWAGAPDSVFTPSDYVNDYTDDYRSRGLWVNWLAGGSSMMPNRKGLNIPIDLSFAFHTDAGTFKNDSIVGTLGIYCTVGDTLGNGASRLASRDLTDLVMSNIVRDVRQGHESHWTRRGMWDKSYFEARVPEVPAMLLELLSHQNFADMKYGLDPSFRYTVARAIYKGMLQFIAHRDGRQYTVQPLPVNNFEITTSGSGHYTLRWAETVDSLEATAHPTYYIVEHRPQDAQGFTQLAIVTAPQYSLTVDDSQIHSYRIIAANDGGISFPSEVLALANLDNDAEPVLVVNGFTRVSAPDWFEASEAVAGFYDQRDHGVPYINDISFIGSQFEYRRNIPWMDDDAAGFGASRSDYEDKVVAGNTFDYVYTHGQAIVAAGHSFISSSVGAYMASPITDNSPRIVDLILGKQKEIKHGRGEYGTYFKAFPAALQQKLTQATAAGTGIFVSGAFIATDIWDNPFSDEATAEADQKFATDVLGYHWRVGQAAVTGQAYQVKCRFRQFTGGSYEYPSELNPDIYAVESPDSFYAANSDNGCTIMRYGENNLVAGIAAKFPAYRTVALGFPFETIYTDEARTSLMTQILNFLTDKQ